MATPAQPPSDGARVAEPRERAPEQAPLIGGELNAAVTSAVVGIYTEHVGRGPASASTFHTGNLLVTLMRDVLTRAEKSLVSRHPDALEHMRHLFHEAMEPDFRAAVERLTGRKVVALVSGRDIEADLAAELFILDELL